MYTIHTQTGRRRLVVLLGVRARAGAARPAQDHPCVLAVCICVDECLRPHIHRLTHHTTLNTNHNDSQGRPPQHPRGRVGHAAVRVPLPRPQLAGRQAPPLPVRAERCPDGVGWFGRHDDGIQPAVPHAHTPHTKPPNPSPQTSTRTRAGCWAPSWRTATRPASSSSRRGPP